MGYRVDFLMLLEACRYTIKHTCPRKLPLPEGFWTNGWAMQNGCTDRDTAMADSCGLKEGTLAPPDKYD